MKMQRALFLAVFFCGIATAQSPPEHPLLTPERVTQLEAGEIVLVKMKEDSGEKSASAKAAVMGVINKPAKDAWATLTAFGTEPEFMPRVETVEKYDTAPPHVGLHFMIKVAWKKINYYLLMTLDAAAMRMTWVMDETKPNEIAAASGSWLVLPWGEDRCIAIHETAVDTGMAVPKFIAQMLMNQDLPGVIEALKQRVESGGTWKK